MKNKGFSLIEVMVVILIIGIMTAIVAPNILGNQEEAQLKKAAVDIQQLEGALEMYKLRNNTFPTTEQGLDALVTAPTIEPLPRNYPDGGFIKRLPDDPWGNPYGLISPGELSVVDIFSNGPDGQPGTDDDIGNWNINEYLN
ncbi:type II secretion system major pseudopilin GspG [Alteromonas oceanisediminis]|uniref:type II secretion system major pseudopilin GspG n=1 Tax=Alteromonas oceanisediminis TaxID=2836180 RepID=UPI001BDAF1F7|nr:type II secretion system major pseudopilin GspG [Alteromonas oceanisediminis]MBT0587855.1 type II secretion system major pseudopilin GspG [Alteromonas oceanisediminis]